MLVVLSAGLLTVLTGTAISQLQPAFADDKEECNDNGDDNCNEENQIIHQENNCKIVNEVENDDRSDNNSNGDNGNGDITCCPLHKILKVETLSLMKMYSIQ